MHFIDPPIKDFLTRYVADNTYDHLSLSTKFKCRTHTSCVMIIKTYFVSDGPSKLGKGFDNLFRNIDLVDSIKHSTINNYIYRQYLFLLNYTLNTTNLLDYLVYILYVVT